MMKIYYMPGTCATAAHITAEETGAPYEALAVDFSKGANRQPGFLALNDLGKVPVLDDDGTIVTENVAIQYYLAEKFPEARLAPSGLVGRTQWLATNAWLATTLHPVFSRIWRPALLAESEGAQAEIRTLGAKVYMGHLRRIDQRLSGQPWLNGSTHSTSDAYALVFYAWGAKSGLPVDELMHFTQWKDRMLERPAVRKVLEREGSALLSAQEKV